MKLNLDRLQAALDAAGLDQRTFAERVSWSEAKASRFLNGKTKDVTMAMLEDVKKALGPHANIAALLDLEDVAQSDREREILRRYREADEHAKTLAEMAVKAR